MPTIHPTAVVEPQAKLADDVVVGPMCYVGPRVTLGAGTRLVSHVSIVNRTTLGAANTVWPQAVLGGQPQDLKYHGEDTALVVGDHNEIRESATLHIGTENGGGVTRVGSYNLIMAYAHVAHDCVVGDHVIVSNAVQMAGHVHIENHATLMGAAALHHFVTVGQYAMVGGMTRIVQDVPPFMIVEGNPSRVRGVNAIGLERNHFSPETIERLKNVYRRLFRGDNGQAPEGAMEPMHVKLAAEYPDDPHVAALLEALHHTAAGVYGRYRESLRHDNRHTNPAR